jgi:hypothetical protein
MSVVNETNREEKPFREGEAPSEPIVSGERQTARTEPRPPNFRRRIWIGVEAMLVLLIAGLIYATILPAIVGRSKNADRWDYQRERNRPTTK